MKNSEGQDVPASEVYYEQAHLLGANTTVLEDELYKEVMEWREAYRELNEHYESVIEKFGIGEG